MGGSPSPPHLWGEALGAATQRGTKPALGSGAYKPPDRHSSATGTHTHALDHGQHSPEDTDEGDMGGRRRWGSKLWPGTRQSHPDQEPRGPWLRAGPAMPCPIASCPSLQHATLPGGTVGSRDHTESHHPSNTSLQESCRLRRELKSA